jgi:hypothetical protein
MSKYIIEALEALPIGEVLEHFQLEHLKGNSYRCPNDHKKPARVTVYAATNICKCHNCEEVKVVLFQLLNISIKEILKQRVKICTKLLISHLEIIAR